MAGFLHSTESWWINNPTVPFLIVLEGENERFVALKPASMHFLVVGKIVLLTDVESAKVLKLLLPMF